MRHIINFSFVICIIIFFGCSKDEGVMSTDAHDVFAVRSNGNDMTVKVEGNTLSKIIILFVHGGPGEGSWIFNKFSAPLKEKYAIALWDQSNSGTSQGNNSKNQTVDNTLINLDKVVKALQHRYNNNFEFYLMGHSCGGGFSAGYLGADNNQSQFQGYINIDGAHNLTLVKEYQREELLKRAEIEINKNSNTEQWKEMKQFCIDHPSINTIEDFSQLSLNCGNSTSLIDSVYTYSLVNSSTFFGEYSFLSYLTNWSSLWKHEDYIKEIFWETDFTDRLPNITIPTLVVWGKFDLNLSYQMAQNYLDNVGSVDKEVVIMEHSGHYPFAHEPEPTFNAIINFVERTK
ncbi:MAG: alpha/beta hydrolase [Bacteroidota bacterium]